MNLKIKDLVCEYLYNPIGIDVTNPRFSWKLESNENNTVQTSYKILVAKDKGFFTDLVWDSGKVISDNSIHITYSGEPLSYFTKYYYKVRVQDNHLRESDWLYGSFETGHSPKWSASWIYEESESERCPLFVKNFKSEKSIHHARIYSTALGVYEIKLNGERVTDWLFTPGFTSYDHNIQVQTYDITNLVKNQNQITVLLGNGWYKGYLGFENQKNYYGANRALLLELHITYDDGEIDIIKTDENWEIVPSPILYSEIYHGEKYDATLEDIRYPVKNAKTYTHSLDMLVPQSTVPVKAIEEIIPINVITTPKGETVLDFGQNMVGYVAFNAQGKYGESIILEHAEILDSEGNFYTANMRTAKNKIEYIFKGEGTECFNPHFTFQGFRYVKVTYNGCVLTENFKGIVIHSDMEKTGSFICSNPLINQLQHNILWGQKGNFLDVPTDCPQRDERLGWTGDAQMFIRTASYNMNIASFFTKWLRDLNADQTDTYGVPYVIPNMLGQTKAGSAAWGDAAAICPWTIYLCFGDTRIIENQFDSARRWVEFMKNQGDNPYLFNTGFHYGDWLALDAKENSYKGATPEDFVASAFYAYSTEILVKMCDILNKTDEKVIYQELYNNIIKNFREEFVTPSGRLAAHTQTAHVLALSFNLTSDKKRTAKDLVTLLENNNYYLTTGFVGTPYLCHVLSENGYTNIAYKVLMQVNYPSWLYPITKGATTIWEHWDGIKEDGSFWSADMNSFNHYAYGAIGDFLYRVVAGIDVTKAGYKHFTIEPRIGGELRYAIAEYECMYGKIKSAWEIHGNTVKYSFTIPANTTATVKINGCTSEFGSGSFEIIDRV